MNYETIISTKELTDLIETSNPVVIDVRFMLSDTNWGRNEFDLGHIPLAQYVHLDDDLSGDIIKGVTGRHPWPADEEIESLFSKLGIESDSQVVAYDQSHGGIAARFWAICAYAGLKNVAILNGGWASWVSDELPVSNELTSVEQSLFKLSASPHLELISVDAALSSGCLIDARAHQRYLGVAEPIDPVAGHIPNAISLPFLDNLSSEFKWKSKEELQKRFVSAQSNNCAIYCGSGVTACHNIIAMKIAGYKLPALYAGSWSHYITDENREIALG